jgi:hypothetical protein
MPETLYNSLSIPIEEKLTIDFEMIVPRLNTYAIKDAM